MLGLVAAGVRHLVVLWEYTERGFVCSAECLTQQQQKFNTVTATATAAATL